MFKKFLTKNTCWIISGAILLTFTACGNKSEEVSDDSTKEVAGHTEPKTKEVPIPGQMGSPHAGMAGGGAGPHGGMTGGGAGPHGDMSAGAMGSSHGGGAIGSHGNMAPELTESDFLSEPFKAKRKSNRSVEVSDEVKKKWHEVSIHVRDKKSGTSKHYKVKMNSDFEIPGTDLSVKVGAFLPHFTMPTGGKIASVSSEPKNPALQVVINEKDKEQYRGWLFSKFPEMHAFEHEKYAISLDDDFKTK